jgi:hypothetical protein
MEGFLKLFELHEKDLMEMYGKFEEHKSFETIIKLEH